MMVRGWKAASIVPFLGLEMNTGLIPLVRRTLVVAAMALALPCFSQDGKDGLTKDFDKLSAKERTKIAAKENQEASVDTSYQSVMHTAESAFQGGDYEKALAKYEEARKMRPYNVYPKVKIQDLQALLKRKAEEKATQAEAPPDMAAPPSVVPPPMPVLVTVPTAPMEPPLQTKPTSPTVKPQPAPGPVPEKHPAPTKLPAAGTAHAPVARAPQEASGPKNLGERVFFEAGAVVTERTVMDDDRPTVYRRVVHPSGQVFTFKDGISIPERMWNERFGE